MDIEKTGTHPLYDDCDCKDSWEHLQFIGRDDMDNSSRIFKDEVVGCNTPVYPNNSQIFFPSTPTFPTPTPTVELQATLLASPTIPELYADDLNTIIEVMAYLDDLARVSGVFSVEIRVKTDDVDTWAVIGYGESGDAAVLRFESP